MTEFFGEVKGMKENWERHGPKTQRATHCLPTPVALCSLRFKGPTPLVRRLSEPDNLGEVYARSSRISTPTFTPL